MTLEDLYRENYPIVYGYLLSLCMNPVTAEDLASETFLRAIQKAGSYDGSCKPSTWLCAIGKNLFLNEQKRERRKAPLEEAVWPAEVSVEEAYIERDVAAGIYRAAKGLEEPYRQVFFMRLAGLSFLKIGEALGKTENWARVTYFRAKTKIQQRTEGRYGSL